MRFQVHKTDSQSSARRGTLSSPRGVADTPTFMPVGTLGTVKGVEIEQLKATGAQIVLGNTYHLALRPGDDIVAKLGGLHQFMGWPGLILTDSGGFQVFSLAHRARTSDEGVVFQAHTDGRRLEMTPERSLEIQRRLGSDIAMVLDHVVALPNETDRVHDAYQRTILWAKRSREYMATRNGELPAVFAIVQGGLDAELRARCAQSLVALDFDGYAIGGLSVGESPAQMYRMLAATCPYLPENQARYLMGVGRPEDMLEAIRHGVDMFDCVIPTRNGRNALAFTDHGPLRLRNRIHQQDSRPLEPDCPCAACRRSRGYLRHLFQSGEMLGPILLSIHNLTYYQRLMSQARTAIENGVFAEFYQRKMAAWARSD